MKTLGNHSPSREELNRNGEADKTPQETTLGEGESEKLVRRAEREKLLKEDEKKKLEIK